MSFILSVDNLRTYGSFNIANVILIVVAASYYLFFYYLLFLIEEKWRLNLYTKRDVFL